MKKLILFKAKKTEIRKYEDRWESDLKDLDQFDIESLNFIVEKAETTLKTLLENDNITENRTMWIVAFIYALAAVCFNTISDFKFDSSVDFAAAIWFVFGILSFLSIIKNLKGYDVYSPGHEPMYTMDSKILLTELSEQHKSLLYNSAESYQLKIDRNMTIIQERQDRFQSSKWWLIASISSLPLGALSYWVSQTFF